tara:strand:+ start:264 stop:500 length:237 start_codon:yes stop_codon:yes gene_type:complete
MEETIISVFKDTTNSNKMSDINGIIPRKLSDVIDDLKLIADEFKLKLNRVDEFSKAVKILDTREMLRVDHLKDYNEKK